MMANASESSPLGPFSGQDYLNLETLRKSGVAVLTPVWFVEEIGIIYVRTEAHSGKVKRIRNNPQVRIAPCDSRGGLKGNWVAAEARLVSEAQAARINTLLVQKYGWLKRAFDIISRFRKAEPATLAILVQPAGQG